MAIINPLGEQIWCPICGKEMTHRRLKYYDKFCELYFCRPCEIGIYDFDPAFNKWKDADKNIPCPHCNYHAINWFARFLDGFFKGVCPKCKTVIKKDGDVKFGKRGQIIIPEEMEGDVMEEPVEIHIPFSHLEKKFGKDRVRAFKNKQKRANNS